MALTRLFHFGHDLQPADASWAVFLLGGAFLPEGSSFFALCVEAAAIDVVALSLGIDRACMTPAYLCLLPAYGVLWWGGRVAGRNGSRSYLRLGAAALIAATLAFAITNGSYFLLSSEVAWMTFPAFVAGVSPYYASYVLTTLIYAMCGCALARWARRSPKARCAVSLDVA